jgi:hypothetical protein
VIDAKQGETEWETFPPTFFYTLLPAA